MRDPETGNAVARVAVENIAKLLMADATVLIVLLLFAADVASLQAQGAPTDIAVWATAYSWREPAHKKWGTKNAIGGSLARPLEGLGHCAVDPKVIPLGSILRVPGIGPRIATDTGRLIRGRDLDIHFDSLREMRAWGARRVTVRVLRWGWGKPEGSRGIGISVSRARAGARGASESRPRGDS